MRMQKFFLALLLVSPLAAFAAAPTINTGGIVNTASFVPAGLPQYGIAQGSIFAVFGSGMGPADLVSTSFPLQTTLANTSIQINAGGQAFSAYMIFTQDGQLAAILPSNVPAGNATMTVTFNGQASNAAAFTVVQSDFGIFTANNQGTGSAIVQNFVSAAVQPFNNLITPAQPGQVEILWGTGLGPFRGAENVSPGSQDPGLSNPIGNNVSVFVGNVSAPIQYNGRTPCCAGEDEIVFTVPPGVLGCYVPVQVMVNGILSNTATMAISAAAGTPCSDASGYSPAEITTIQNQDSTGFALLTLQRVNNVTSEAGIAAALQTQDAKNQDQISTLAANTSSTASADSGEGHFGPLNKLDLIINPNILGSYVSLGYCGTYTSTGTDAEPASSISWGPKGWDAGTLFAAAGSATRMLPSVKLGKYENVFSTIPGNPSSFFFPTANAVNITGSGGANVGPIQVGTNYFNNVFASSVNPVDRIQHGVDFTVTWTPLANTFTRLKLVAFNSTRTANAAIDCLTDGGSGTFTFRSSLIDEVLPDGGHGYLQAENMSKPTLFTASGSNISHLIGVNGTIKSIGIGDGSSSTDCVPFPAWATFPNGALFGFAPPPCLFPLNTLKNITVTNSLQFSGNPSTVNGKTLYQLNLTGSGAGVCPNGTPTTWQFNNFSFVASFNEAVSTAGPLDGTFTVTSGPSSFIYNCGPSQQPSIILPGVISGGSSGGSNGPVTATLGVSSGGWLPLFIGGNNSFTAAVPGALLTQISGATGTLSFVFNESASGTQTSLTGNTATAAGTVICPGVSTPSTYSVSATATGALDRLITPTSTGPFGGTAAYSFLFNPLCGQSKFKVGTAKIIGNQTITGGPVFVLQPLWNPSY